MKSAATGLLVASMVMIATPPCQGAYIGGAKIATGRGIGGVLIEGEILPGDFAKFEKVILQRGDNIDPVWLASPGGDLGEAMKIGRLIRELKLSVWAPDNSLILYPALSSPANAVCASACFFMFAAGVERRGAVIGVHRPYFSKDAYKAMGLDEAAAKQGLVAEEATQFIKDMGVPNSIVEKMMRTNSDQMAWLTADDVKGLSGYIPEYAEWFKARCPAPTALSGSPAFGAESQKQFDCQSQLMDREQTKARVSWHIKSLERMSNRKP